MLNKCLFFIIYGKIWTIIMCKSYYSILAPGTVKSNRNYTVSVTLHAAFEPAIIRVGLSRAQLLDDYQDVLLQPFETKSLHFTLPKLGRDEKYELVAEGIRGLSFKNSTELLVDDRDPLKIYIQTSKGIYKPGDVVQFRVIILNDHMKPMKLNEPVGVQIQDSKGHRVKQFKDIKLVKGLFSGSIPLSEQPNLGIWKIIVLISGKYDLKEVKPFEVNKYVLPKFSVHIDAVNDFVREDQILPVTVYGKYLYGKYVEGTVTAKIKILNRAFTTQTKDIQDYKAKFEFNITKHIRKSEIEPEFDVEAIFTDKYTNISLSARKTIRNHNERYKIVVPIEEIEFRDNRPHLIKAKVRYLNNTEVIDRTTPVFMEHGSREYKSFLDEHGSASFIFDYEDDKNNKFRFKKTTFELINIFANGELRNDSLCNLKIRTGKLRLGKVVEVEVTSQSHIPYLVYVLTGHGNIIYANYVQLNFGQNSYIIKFDPTIEMVPSTKLCVHYIEQNQLNYCEIQIKFSNEFENKVTVSTSNITVTPGQEVRLNIHAQPHSRVGLLALDLGAHLLNSNYSINKNEIFKQLLNDQSYTHYTNIIFGQQAGLVILTNADTINLTPTAYFGFRKRLIEGRSANKFDMQTQVRTKFPETWIFEEIEILNENTSLSLNIPDTITTWLVTAISVNENSGFGMTDESLNITVFQPFFISTNLPYSIKRGETVAIPLTIFNYYEQDLDCQVVMHNSDGEFQFVEEETGNLLNLTQAVQSVHVVANSGSSVKFVVKALKLGLLNISLIAAGPLAVDAINQQLKVAPEGILINDNQQIYLTLQSNGTQKSSLKAEIPHDVVSESEFVRVSMGGNVLAQSLENLNQLVSKPYGCGEQNMIRLAPNILVLDYLKTLNKWQNFSNLVIDALNFIEIGYQKQMTFRHDTGGYSVFGPGGTESTWLTAYVVRFFIKAVRYVGVEPDIITSGLDFLTLKQQASGEFPNTGHLFYPAHQNPYGFTAFILLSFMESKKYRKQYHHVIQKGLDFLTTNLNNTNDPYALSIMATAFQMAQISEISLIREKLLSLQQREGDQKWWTSTEEGHSNDVEITAYALISLLEKSDIDHISIFRWIIEQRNENGGFETTQNTVVGLEALIKFSKKYKSLPDTHINVTYSAKDEQGLEVKNGVFEVTADNLMILQQEELPRTTRSIQYEATGHGNSLLQFSYQYYVSEIKNISSLEDPADITSSYPPEAANVSFDAITITDIQKSNKNQRFLQEERSFIIEPIAKMVSDNEMLMDICFKYLPSENLKLQKTNMIILDINLPSGFVCNPMTLDNLLEEELVTKTELENSDTKIIIYFDQLYANDEHCLKIQADKAHEVKLLRRSAIEMYDFYNSDLRNVVFYETKI